MFKTNEYFDGKVMSIAFQSVKGPTTIGVMAKGNYEFGTTSKEYMTVTCGRMEVLLPGETEYRSYHEGEMFIVEKNEKFKVKLAKDTSYKCLYE